ncbi:MAG: TetR/AcrR family transcriptional regulator [Oscillospiraceae bacterium]|nr:TetR/AcrR family transcriptional regulator [Oscillospiraceae bacterium]
MDKISKKKSDKYIRIIDSAFELFEKRDPHVVSIDEIVKTAGIAKGTFYLYFHDKHDLVSRLILDKAEKYMNEISFEKKEIATDEEFGKTLRSYLEYLCAFLEKNKTLTMLIDKNINVCVNAIVETKDSPLFELYKEIESYLIKCGTEEKDFTVRFYLYVELIVSSCCNAILREHPYGLYEVKYNLYKIILDGIAGEKLAERLCV